MLGFVQYFTTWVKGDPSKNNRQQTYIRALRSHNNDKIKMKFGRYQLFTSHCKHCKSEPLYCKNCGGEYSKSTEKKTDVNISVSMIVDCFTHSTDCVILVSGDSDYEAPLVEIENHFPSISRVIAFPPRRKNPSLYDKCDRYFVIKEDSFKNSQLPNPVITEYKNKIYKPDEWL